MNRRSRLVQVLILPTWCAVIAAGLASLYHVDDRLVPWPPFRDPHQLMAWASVRSPAELSFAVVRIGAIAVGWYLLGIAALALAAAVSGASPLAWLAERLTLPSLRPLLLGGLGLSIAAAPATFVPFASSAGAEPRAPAPVMVVITGDEPAVPPPSGGPPVMRVEPPASAVPGAPATAGPRTAPPAPVPVAPAPPAAPAAPTTPPAAIGSVVIQPGDNLWSIAAHALAHRWNRPAGPAEILPYWRSLIDLNRGVLVRSNDPDLVFAGQRLQLPPPPGPPTG